MPEQEQPSSVSAGSRQGGETQEKKWKWVEAEVWTERMLTALEQGVKGGKWFSLMDKVYLRVGLRAAWAKVRRKRGAAGVDRQSVEKFDRRAEQELEQLHQQLKRGEYKPQGVRRCWIEKEGTSKKRPLGIPAVRDRVVQTALRQVLEPIFEVKFCEQSYGFRSQRGAKDALRRVEELLHAGYPWVVDADIENYFEQIDHGRLMEEVKKEVADGSVLRLLKLYLEQEVLEGMERWQPERGTPQGAVISPLLANIYLHPVDEAMEAAQYQMIRYADDLVILCRTQEEAQGALQHLQAQVQAWGLKLHPEKTRVVDAREPGGFDFLGYHFERGRKWPRRRSLKRLYRRLRPLTRRNHGESLRRTMARINPILRGWFQYYQHSQPKTFEIVDGWVRMRLRSILRRRRGLKGRGRGWDHQRWPNAYFIEQGLFTLQTAHATICQSRAGPH